MRIFLICSVRNAPEEERAAQRTYVEKLEATGHNVYWPPRNTNQDDPIGLRICEQNRMAIYDAQEIHIWYSKGSEGSRFDLGMAFAFALLPILGAGNIGKKKFVLANPEAVKPTPHKSFENVLLALAGPSK